VNLPQDGEAMEITSLSELVHPYHQENYEMWQECYLSYKGGAEFIERSIRRHQLEFEDDFEIRKERAFYLNFVKRIVNAMTDIIFDNIIVRPSAQKYPILRPFYRKASYFGESYDVFARRMSKLSSVFGWVVVGVEFLAGSMPTQADVVSGRNYPRLALYTPLEFVDWSRVGDRFSYGLVKRTAYVRSKQGAPLQEVDEYILFTDKTISIYHDGHLVGSFSHDLGYAPLVLVNDSTVDEFGFSDPLIKDIAKIAGILVNWLSVLDEIFERQTLSQLVCPDDGSLREEAAALMEEEAIYEGMSQRMDLTALANLERRVLKRIGKSKIFTYPANAGHPPQYISPPGSDMRIGWEIIMQLATTIFFLVGLGGIREDAFSASSKARQSALSLMQSYLKDKASNLQSAEESILRIYFDYVGMGDVFDKDQVEVRYPAEIDAGPYVEFFETTIKSLLGPNISPTFNKAILQRLVDKCPYLTTEEKEQIKLEIGEELSGRSKRSRKK